MKFLNRLERSIGRYAIHNVTLGLVVLQGVMWVLMQGQPGIAENLVLEWLLILGGQWWRLFTFIFLPPANNAIFLFFALWLLYLMGTALENQWGAFRFNLYLLIGYLATVGSVFLAPRASRPTLFSPGRSFWRSPISIPNFPSCCFSFCP